MGLRDFARSLRPGNDRQLAADLATQRSTRHRTTSARRADRQGQAWETRDRAQERRGGKWYRAAR